jgi:hypothetical protein
MCWFRNNVRIGVRVAFLALTLQLFLSFAHVQLAAFPQQQERSASLAADDDGLIPNSPPAGRDPFCAICTLIQLVGNSVCPVAPIAELPWQFDSALLEETVSALLPTTLLLSFEARAPPCN